MTKTRQVVATALLVFAATRAEARKPKPAPQKLTADQQLVVAAVVNDTFPRPRAAAPLALCLDVQLVAVTDEAGDDEAPTPPPRAKKHGRKHATPVELPKLRGAPPELVEQLTRPWRAVASALACSTDPRKPLTLGDAQKTPARLVTVHVAATAATGSLKIDWTSGQIDDPNAADATSSRDCTAINKGNGWTVHCGGTWFQ